VSANSVRARRELRSGALRRGAPGGGAHGRRAQAQAGGERRWGQSCARRSEGVGREGICVGACPSTPCGSPPTSEFSRVLRIQVSEDAKSRYIGNEVFFFSPSLFNNYSATSAKEANKWTWTLW
jgi:hypothetical protein